ncbi:hypothetical protein F5Y19DRAFT_402562 [Xylariaceae sp. FL1651]|nr:hypothetical protein F5Y19DRAFT_402562 [Xylariaceae sp. FL1651]
MYVNLMFSLALLGTLVTGAFLLFLSFRRQRRREKGAGSPEATGTNEKSPFRDVEDYNDAKTQSLPDSVTSNADLIGRDQWVLRMTRYVFNERHRSRYNVLVINNDLEYHFSPKGVVEDFFVTYRDSRRAVPYRIVVFTEGTLLNLGDGGDINWDWMGNFVRPYDSMLAFKPCKVDVKYQQDAWIAVG